MQIKRILILIVIILIVVGAGLYVDSRMKYIGPAVNSNSTPGVNSENYGPAPDFVGIENWLNSKPLKISDLRGKVVLIDFWTYSCINCIRTLPYVTRWYDTYKDKGLVVVGVHTPEFAFERDASNVKDAIMRFNIHYPVAQDNNYATWNAYSNQYWPAEYLIDKNENIIHVHFGEGEYDTTENTIRSLLGLGDAQGQLPPPDLSGIASPEMYFGTNRLANLTPEQSPSFAAKEYSLPPNLSLNNFALEGNWQFSAEEIKLTGGQGKIKLKFHAGKIHLVAASQNSAQLVIVVDGKTMAPVTVKSPQLYTLFDSNNYTDHIIEITVEAPGFEAFTFTFG